MREVYELAPVIADVIAAHCPGTTAREHFVRACLGDIGTKRRAWSKAC